MALYSISGVGCCGDYSGMDMSGIGRKTKQQKKEKRQKKRIARKYGENCKGRTAAKIAPPLILGRRSFLTIVSLNLRGLGKKLVLAFRKPEARVKILEKWCALGGNAAVLKNTIAKVEARLKRKGKISYIGVEPTTTATFFATAAPILAAILPIIAKFLPAESEAREVLEQGAEAAQTYSEQTTDENNDVSGLGQEGPTNVKTLPEVVIKASYPKKIKPIWLIAAVIGGYFIGKQKFI